MQVGRYTAAVLAVTNAGGVRTRTAKLDFALRPGDAERLAQNAQALVRELVARKPTTAKGVYLKSITVSSTMGPGVRVDAATAAGEEEH